MFEFSTKEPEHDPFGLYRKLLEDRAFELAEKMCRRLIRFCMSQELGLFIDNGLGLKNLWDEICVAFQTDSYWTESYTDHLVIYMNRLVSSLPQRDIQMLWLMSYEGFEYATSPQWPDPYQQIEDGVAIGSPPSEPWPSINPEDWPINTERLAKRLVDTFVLEECMNYENARIKNALTTGAGEPYMA